MSVKNLLIVSAVLTGLLLTGCPAVRNTAGVWQLAMTPRESGDEVPLVGNDPLITFTEDLRFTMTGDGNTIEGSWTVDGKEVLCDSDPVIYEGQNTIQLLMKRSGDKMEGVLAWFPPSGSMVIFDFTGQRVSDQGEISAEGEGEGEGES